MKNIFKIYKRDLKKIFTNSMAIILAVGIAVLPSLYAWFNIYANWDPYGPASTGNMKVAVVINDEGYEFKGVEINVGDQIKSNLKANDMIDWQFVSKERAVNGIKAGDYYAGIEIPKGFSKSLTSIMTKNFKQPKITYYANEKKNAIATKITDKVVQTIQTEVNESFVTTVINLVNKLLGTVIEQGKKEGTNIFQNLQNQIDSAQSAVKSVEKTIDGFEGVMEVAQDLNKSLSKTDLSAILGDTKTVVSDTQDAIKVAESSVDAVTSSVGDVLKSSSKKLANSANNLKKINDATSDKAQAEIKSVLAECAQARKELQAIVPALEKVNNNLPKPLSSVEALIKVLKIADSRLGGVENELNKILKGDTSKKIGDVADKLTSVSTTLDSSLSTYTKEIKPQLDKTVDSLLDVLFDVSNLLTTIENQSPQLNALVKSLNGSIEAGDDLLTSLHSLISNCAKQLEILSKKLDGLGDSEIVNTLMNLTEGNSDDLGSFIACPVKVNTDKIYGIDNYGSAMAPFYSTLALWVGAIILVALIKPKVANKKEIGNIKPREEYFGRSLIFLTISLVQGLIICLGDLYFLKIQCYHPVKFIFAGLCASFVFTFFIYSLVAAWGDIGKAVAVIMLVVQLGGCGGTFPIDVTPAFFRAINPYLPYTFVIDALRECVCGTYGNNYWICLGKLFVYFFIGLLIGTLFRYLFRKPMRFFEKKVEETGLL